MNIKNIIPLMQGEYEKNINYNLFFNNFNRL